MYRTPFFTRVLALALLLLLPFTRVFSAQETLSPEDTVRAFYDDYIAYTQSEEGFRNPLIDGIYRDSPYLTTELIETVDDQISSAAEIGLNYDLFLCAQDIPQHITTELITQEAEQASVLLREYFGGPRSFRVTLVMVQDAGTWKINEAQCGDTATARGVVEDFYKWYIGLWQAVPQEDTGDNPLTGDTFSEYPYLTESFVQTIRDEAANMQIGGGDPLLCAQDIPDPGVVWAYEIDIRSDEALVLADMFFSGSTTTHHITLNLIKDGEQWMIGGLTCGVTPEHMAQLIYREYADHVRFNIDHNIEANVLETLAHHWRWNVDEALKADLINQIETCDLEADPVMCVQDIPEGFAVDVMRSTETEALIQVNGLYPAGPDMFNAYSLGIVTMRLIDGEWTLTEIRCMAVC